MKKIIALFSTCFLLTITYANNVVISNVSLVNGGPNNIYVQFNLSWENSWRVGGGPANYDGVWVFFKYKTLGGDWQHLYLNTSTGADLLPTGFDYFRPLTGVTSGAAIHRSATNSGTGNITASGIRLTVINSVPYDIELRSYAIEMVYIPAPASDIRFGDGNGVNESGNAFHIAGSDNNHTRNNLNTNVDVNSIDDSEIETPNSFVINGNGTDGIAGLPINNLSFPTTSAIWCMKYEMTQGAYRDFLNTLTLTQQTTRTANPPNSAPGTGALTTSGTNRNFIEIRTPSAGAVPAVYGCDASGNDVYDEAADGEFISCNFLNWQDLAAWLDWAGLAPMTEIQFERICRGTTSAGPIIPVFGEYAWGNTSIFPSPYTFTGAFTASEVASNASTTLGNAAYGSTTPGFGPLRNGIFATGSSNRTTSGAAFYGVMEMSGGLTEGCVTVGNVAGRSFNKLGTSRGNGTISTTGNADVPHWPGNVVSPTLETLASGEVTSNAGAFLRGGDFSISLVLLRASGRDDGVMSSVRANFQGGRGVIVMAMY
jgi:hypothetical protein